MRFTGIKVQSSSGVAVLLPDFTQKKEMDDVDWKPELQSGDGGNMSQVRPQSISGTGESTLADSDMPSGLDFPTLACFGFCITWDPTQTHWAEGWPAA